MRILHLEDDPADALLVTQVLSDGCPDSTIYGVANRREFIAALSMEPFDVVLADFNLPGFSGMEALTLARQLAPTTPFVFFSGSIGEDQAIAALQAGAADYVLKDRMKRLPAALRRVCADNRERRLRQEAEASLAASQARYERLINEAQDAIFSLSPTGAITSLNPAFEAITGWPRERWIGRHFLELIHDSDRARAEDRFQRLEKEKRPAPFELLLNTAAGATVAVEFSVSYSQSARGTELLGVGRDITARKRAETTIRHLSEVIDQAPVAIVMLDLKNCVVYWNRGATLLYGWTADEMRGRCVDEMLHGETRAALEKGRQAVQREGAWRGEIPVVTKDGRRLDAEYSMSLIRDDHGAPIGRLSIAIDITEKNRLQAQFLRAQRMENLGLLAAGIAHDFNNILAPILMVAQLLRTDDSAESRRRLLGTLEQSAERGAALVKQILSFAHGGTEGLTAVQLKHIARDVIAMVEETFPKNIRFSHHVPSDLWAIRGNPTHLHQVLLNLCVNARDAMPQGGELRLTIENRQLDDAAAHALRNGRPGSFVIVEVSDTGTGIPTHVLPHIWEPFFTTKESGKGTGLGLSTVRGILRTHDGFVDVQSTPGRGTTFCLFFPADLSSLPAEAPPPGFAELPRGNGELVLVIDDEASVRDLVHAVLARQGYQVALARDGVEAMNLLRLRPQQRPRVVVTDVVMPRLGGEALLPLLRLQLPEAKIIVMSGMGSADAPQISPESGDAFLLKPFKPDALLEAIHRLLRAPASGDRR
jgi:PAS domain S-box-containing protein